ncbi:autotransporter outer membrane beta-barrel domain-containing protein [Phreatobacter stygius]|uniref:autotransporter outer membrane beta-barrel domain-containing protein n=1 Tax=Phreatobacter stygius TaxID=1940610 RepID=UPI0014775DD5|nr:autotransporter domain-containing protein [Phreatobacter stygius]
MFATGALTITGGGTATTGGAQLGTMPGGNGTATVDGAGSRWSTGFLYVGSSGIGRLDISGGATVETTIASAIGSAAGGSGTVNVSGPSSTWNNLTGITVGWTGNGVLNITDGATVNSLFGHISDTAPFGTGKVTVSGPGSTWNTGEIRIGSGGAGSLTIADGGHVSVTAGSSVTVGGAPGTGSLIIGSEPYSGMVGAGTLAADQVVLNGSGKLVFSHWTWADYRFEPVIAGAGKIEHYAGATILTADSSGFTGTTRVNGGALIVNGALGGTTEVAMGVIAGTGTLATLNANGVVAPGAFYTWTAVAGGNEIGTLNVSGNATFSSRGSLYINVSATGADRLAVGGTATLAGNLALIPVGTGFQFGTRYTILTAAGGITGTFDRMSSWGSFGAVRTTLAYGTNEVTLTLDPNMISPLLPTGASRNTRNVAGAMDRAVMGGANGSAFLPLYLQSQAGMVTGLNGLSGEAATGTQTAAFGAASLFLNMMLDPMAGARGATAGGTAPSLIQMADLSHGRPRPVAADQGWSVWTKAFAQSNKIGGDGATGSAATSGGLFGLAAGADKRLTPDTMVGFALAGGGTNFGLGTARGSGTGDLFQAGLYGSTRIGDGYVSAALAYGWNSFDVTRSVAMATAETYASRVTAQTYGGRVEAGWRFKAAAFGWTPYAALEAIGYSAPRYGETTQAGGGAFALNYAAKTATTVRTELGMRLDGHTRLEAGDLHTYGRLAWAYQATADRSVGAQFQTLANSAFTVFGARPSTHTALATIGAELRLSGGVRLTTSIDGELGTRHQAIRANAGLRYSW